MALSGKGTLPASFPNKGRGRIRLSRDAFIPLAPFIPKDWPPLTPVRQGGSVDVATNLLLSVLVTAGTALREPLYHTVPVQPAPFEYRVPNLLTSTLAPVASNQMPSTPLDLDVVSANTWRSVEPQLNLLLTTLKPAVSNPFQPVDLTGPGVASLGLPWQPQRNLLLTAVPFRPVDTSVTLPVRTTFAFDAPSVLALTTPPPATPNPFVALDFPALSRTQGLPDYAPANLLTGVLLGQIRPFNQLSWPPLAQVPSGVDSARGTNLALLNTPQLQPFNQLNWPALDKKVSPEPFLIPNTTIRQVAPPAPPNLHKLYYDVSSGRLFWRVSVTANPIEIIPL